MNNCEHDKHSKKQVVVKEIFNCKFKFESMVCEKCGSYLWDEEVEQKFNIWLEKLYKEKRERFQVKIPLSGNLRKCIYQLKKNYPGVTDTDLVRAIIVTYLDHISINKKLRKVVDNNISEQVMRSFSSLGSTSSSIKIKFRPKYTIKYLELSNMIDTTQEKMMLDTVNKMMVFFMATNTDTGLKDFWNMEVKKYIDILVA